MLFKYKIVNNIELANDAALILDEQTLVRIFTFSETLPTIPTINNINNSYQQFQYK